MKSQKMLKVFLLFVLIIVLTLGFYNNFWHAANDNWFDEHQKDSESLVVGRLYKSQIDGITSKNSLLGRFYSFPEGKRVDYQYETYKNSLNAEDYIPYKGQIGLQGIIYGLLDKYTSLSNERNLKIFYLINSILLSLILGLISIWIYNEFGIFSFIVVSITILFSQWLTVFGKNLYWSIWIMFLPMLISIYILYFEEQYNIYSNVLVSFLLFISLFIKSSTGYEYISTILISLTIPYFYYFLKNKWDKKIFIKRFIIISLSSLSGFFMAILVHILQLKLFFGSYNKAFNSIFYRILKRTNGNPNKVQEVYRASLESNIFDIIKLYIMHGRAAINLTNLSFFKTNLVIFDFRELIFLFLIISFLVLLLKNYLASIQKNINKLKALIISVWISFLAPLSWFVLAKGHSYIHTTMNYLLWHIPFVILGFALVGYFLGLIIKDVNKKVPSLKNTIIIFVIVLMVILSINNYISVKDRDEKISLLINSSENIVEINNFNIYVNMKENKIMYITNNSKINLDERFFLHSIPFSVETLSEQRQKYGFDNLDFNFKNNDFNIFYFSEFYGENIAIIDLPEYPIKVIRTGQFNNEGNLWKKTIKLNYDAYQNNYLIPYNLKDKNWEKGIFKDGETILLESNLGNIATVQDIKYLILEGNEKIEIQKIQYPNSRWIHVKLKNKIDITKYGYPNKIKVIR